MLFSFASADTYNVTVGSNGQLAFSPTNVTADAGDIILFQFMSVSHSATQSTFNTPCTANSSGFDSGVSSSSSALVQYSVLINDTTPLWVFCKVDSHCASGMVFAVNPTTSQTYDAFKAKAMGKSVSSAAGSTPTATSAGGSSPTPASSGYGYGSSEMKISIQRMTVGLAGVVFLIGLLA